MNDERSSFMRQSLTSLFESGEYHIIVVDNGGSVSDTAWLVENTQKGNITHYVLNRKNMHFAFARNQGLSLTQGEYIVIADNDILYQKGWAEACISFLKENEGKYLATPLAPDPMNKRSVRWCGEQGGWRLNYRAGSNCFMMRRSDFHEIGTFPIHHIAGSLYCDRYVRMGYKMACMPHPLCSDLGLRKGYNLKQAITTLLP